MNQKGLTIIELICAVLILVIIFLVSFPKINGLIERNTKKLYDKQISEIKKSASDWATNNINLLPVDEGEFIAVSLGQLKSEGYINTNVKNPINDELFSNDTVILIKRHLRNYYYTVLENNNNDLNVILNGNYLEYVELNDEYEDKSVIAFGENGEENIKIYTMIKHNDNEVLEVNTNDFNSYLISYTAVSNHLTGTAYRAVIVRDTTKPVITALEKLIIKKEEVEGFDLLDGVSVTDNSKLDLDIMVDGEIKPEPGSYIITYKATDPSGNTNMKKRIINVE